jgi:hypothetical protein
MAAGVGGHTNFGGGGANRGWPYPPSTERWDYYCGFLMRITDRDS